MSPSIFFTHATGGEPDLSGTCQNESDKIILRNIIYTLWAVNKDASGSGGCNCYLVKFCFFVVQDACQRWGVQSAKGLRCMVDPSSCCTAIYGLFLFLQGYNVRRLRDKGYLVLAFFGHGYRISLQDMQLLSDVCPMRIDSMFVRGLQDGDLSKNVCSASSCSSSPPGSSAAGGNTPSSGRKSCQAASVDVADMLGSSHPNIQSVLSICLLDGSQPVCMTEAEVVRVRKRSRGLLSSLFMA